MHSPAPAVCWHCARPPTPRPETRRGPQPRNSSAVTANSTNPQATPNDTASHSGRAAGAGAAAKRWEVPSEDRFGEEKLAEAALDEETPGEETPVAMPDAVELTCTGAAAITVAAATDGDAAVAGRSDNTVASSAA